MVVIGSCNIITVLVLHHIKISPLTRDRQADGQRSYLNYISKAGAQGVDSCYQIGKCKSGTGGKGRISGNIPS